MKRTEAQLIVSDPTRHIWVSASAGTGKTHVLTDRLMRLMLDGAHPERILAVTFTRAAAAEMENRLTERLRMWKHLDDQALDAELADLGVTANAAIRQRARSLFEQVLDVPRGLKVQTLHGFAQGLLAAFPLEAGLAPGFTALEERDALLLRRRALQEAILQGDEHFLAELASLSVMKGEGGVAAIVDVLIRHWPGLSAFRSSDGIEPAIRRLLDVPADASPGDACRQAFVAGGVIEAACWQFAAAMDEWTVKTGREAAAQARAWLALDLDGRVAARDAVMALVWTDKDEVRSWHGQVKKSPALAEAMTDLERHLDIVRKAEVAVECAAFAARVLRVGHEVASRYAYLKNALNVIDFEDMIRFASDLVGQPGMPGYIAWKLDSRYDHVLVDEAQDTNDLQWRIVRQLVSEYFATGTGKRSLCVVGDMKQAIFGFQGTDPRIFANERVRIAPNSDEAIVPVPLDLSFRSGPAILDVVNGFLANEHWRNLGMQSESGKHRPHRHKAAGEVVLWPLLSADFAEDGEDEEAPGDDGSAQFNAEDADRLMAQQLAERIAGWLQPDGPDRLWLPARGRHAVAGDILILLRKRSALMTSLVAALHKLGVPVAGVDRLLLNEPYAVLDPVALVRFATQPEDDLNLAAILASPFIGWSHEAIRSIAQHRPASLWEALGRDDSVAAQTAREWLNTVLNLADRGGPAEFLDIILSGPLNGRRLLLDRLGNEANDPIDELLRQAHAYERDHPPTLAGFLAWIEAEGLEVKRDAETSGNVVRLMTVHGSKGLQSNIVILADTGNQQQYRSNGYVALTPAGGKADIPVYLPQSKGLPDILQKHIDEEKQIDAEENQRLLYVAMTRAADHLYIGGAVSRKRMEQIGKAAQADCWHMRMAEVFDTLPGAETVAGPWGDERRYRAGDWSARVEAEPVKAASAILPFDAVNLAPAPTPRADTRPLTPSSALPDNPPSSPELQAAARRGTLMHRLFERLPDVAAKKRGEVGRKWLLAQGEAEDTARQMMAEVLGVFEHPDLAALFAGEALVEAPIAGVIDGHPIAGTVDRLLIRPDNILIVDYKTGSYVPESEADIPKAYHRQMALYAQVLAQIFPGRHIAAGLLFTAAPKFIPVPGLLTDGAGRLHDAGKGLDKGRPDA